MSIIENSSISSARLNDYSVDNISYYQFGFYFGVDSEGYSVSGVENISNIKFNAESIYNPAFFHGMSATARFYAINSKYKIGETPGDITEIYVKRYDFSGGSVINSVTYECTINYSDLSGEFGIYVSFGPYNQTTKAITLGDSYYLS